MSSPAAVGAEWLEADGVGGFASGTVAEGRTRRYHALLLTATEPPGGRFVLVNGVEVWVQTATGHYPLSTERYGGDVVYPDGHEYLRTFSRDPWPEWVFELPDGTWLRQAIFVARAECRTVLRWSRISGQGQARLVVRPLLSGRDYHALHHENADFDMTATVQGGNAAWQPYRNVPRITALSNGTYRQEPDWYRNFLYDAERARGLDFAEDLAAPGVFEFDLRQDDAVLVLSANGDLDADAASSALSLADTERMRRGAIRSPLERAAQSYIVDGRRGKTILAGFPWFTDWGRDTFISMRGLLLASGRLDEAEAILFAWAGQVERGMLPNRFAEGGNDAEFNAVDASLWFIVAIEDFLRQCQTAGYTPRHEASLAMAAQDILTGYSRGTRHGIGCDDDALLRAGEPGLQLTWMDAKIGDWVVTPRIGKPVEVQALWFNALRIAGRWSGQWAETARAALESFKTRFPDPSSGGLYDVVDDAHLRGRNDARCRPNQIFAVGGLPYTLLDGAQARAIVDLVERKLLTPLGLRTLAGDEPGYVPHFRGNPLQRDSAYHQGTAWPWLLGPFVEAWLHVRGNDSAARHEARERFLNPLMRHLDGAGLGHVSEVADGDPPYTPGGCPFQAWSLGETIRIARMLEEPGRRAQKEADGSDV